MATAMLEFSSRLIDTSRTPHVEINEIAPGKYELVLKMGILAQPTDIGADENRFRLVHLATQLYSSSLGIGIQHQIDSDVSSKLTVVFQAVVNSKLPRTGDLAFERTYDLEAFPLEQHPLV